MNNTNVDMVKRNNFMMTRRALAQNSVRNNKVIINTEGRKCAAYFGAFELTMLMLSRERECACACGRKSREARGGSCLSSISGGIHHYPEWQLPPSVVWVYQSGEDYRHRRLSNVTLPDASSPPDMSLLVAGLCSLRTCQWVIHGGGRPSGVGPGRTAVQPSSHQQHCLTAFEPFDGREQIRPDDSTLNESRL